MHVHHEYKLCCVFSLLVVNYITHCKGPFILSVSGRVNACVNGIAEASLSLGVNDPKVEPRCIEVFLCQYVRHFSLK